MIGKLREGSFTALVVVIVVLLPPLAQRMVHAGDVAQEVEQGGGLLQPRGHGLRLAARAHQQEPILQRGLGLGLAQLGGQHQPVQRPSLGLEVNPLRGERSEIENLIFLNLAWTTCPEKQAN